MSVTIGIPVYNEEELLRPNTLVLLEYLRARGGDFEIFLGSNGSVDRTVENGIGLYVGPARYAVPVAITLLPKTA